MRFCRPKGEDREEELGQYDFMEVEPQLLAVALPRKTVKKVKWFACSGRVSHFLILNEEIGGRRASELVIASVDATV